jgi:uncharacterized protein (TIGR02266 family)
MASAQELNRRRYERADVTLFVLLRHDGGRVAEFARTLGAGGMFVESRAPRPAGTPVDLSFDLPGHGRRTDVCGRVVWARADGGQRPGMGIEFVDLESATRDYIDRLVSEVNQGKFPSH